MPHLATTYAAVNTLITLGGDKALASINRDKLYGFMRRMKQPNGGFRMHDEGEIDVRACYTAISVASLLNILNDELIKNVGDFILSCQTYEGGIAGEPGSEAHGGYTFCGLAAMILIGEANRLDLPRLLDWVVFRQGKECGFQGRTNKLVDGCYSFWQGGAVALLQRLQSVIEEQMVEASQSFTKSDAPDEKERLAGTSNYATSRIRREGISESCSSDVKNIGYNFINEWRASEPLFHSIALQQYILLCAQEQDGGLRDKPGKRRDHYHLCYCLSGLSLCQYSWSKLPDSPPLPKFSGINGVLYYTPQILEEAGVAVLLADLGLSSTSSSFLISAVTTLLMLPSIGLAMRLMDVTGRRAMAVPDPTQLHGLKLMKDYPYAEDGLLIWSAIENWVCTYVNYYYPNPSLIINDRVTRLVC